MSQYNSEQFTKEYQLGKIALERGEYSLSIKHLESTISLISSNSKSGGEVQIWLVTAYQSAGKIEEAIALCQELLSHPSFDIRKQADSILYILKAPRLQRPKEWLTQIPDLSKVSEGETQVPRKSSIVKKEKKHIEEMDLSAVETEDNQFIWIALLGILICGGLFLYISI